MLQRMIARGATIFLTSHVLEIVERLCTHVAIIHKGKLVAQGSLDELRAGAGRLSAASQAASSALHLVSGKQSPGKQSLEEIFLEIVGASGETPSEQELSWLS